MSKTKDLTNFSAIQLQDFLMSFDIVMSDIDGVVRQVRKEPIKGALESLAAMQKLGKQVYLVTNNSTNTSDDILEHARRASLNLSLDHVTNTIKVIVWYLKKIDFRDEAFAIVSDLCRDILKKAGIRLIEPPKAYQKDPKATVKEILDRPSVKAVIVDFDFDLNWPKLSLAVSCLQRKDVLYIAGVTDEWFHVQTTPQKIKVLGGGPLIKVITTHSGRKPILCGKPSEVLKDYIIDTCNVTDPRRCLFIGDTADQDMRFASMCGFTKLFVGTGCDTLEKTQKEEDTCPDYYLPSLGQLFSANTSSQCQHTISDTNN